jgi:thiamine-monophosphate kinase
MTEQPAPLSHQPAQTVGGFSERELIARISARFPSRPDWLLVGIGDDAAVVEPERNRAEVLSVDCVVDGVHFDRAFVPPDAIGHRALAVNLSDLAAMGASPRLALLSMAVPSDLPVADFDAIVDGMATLADRHRIPVIGGNLTRTPGPLSIDVTVIGTIKRRQALTRSGARPGDELYVTGTVGAAAAGLQRLRKSGGDTSPEDAAAGRYLRPEPRLRMGILLARNRAATACIDTSDGLADAVHQLAGASGVGATIDADALPLDPDARDRYRTTGTIPDDVLSSDDYELLFTVRPRQRRRLEPVARQAGLAVTRIGACTSDRQVVATHTGAGRVVTSPLGGGYRHFR